MPPKKVPAKVSNYFPKAEKKQAQEQGATADTMALMKEDLLASLKEFKTELRAELKLDIKTSLDQLKDNLTERMTALQQDVDSVGTRVWRWNRRPRS